MVDNKEIRVFISSTFNDMNKERDLLMKHVVQKLSAICQSRGGILTVIDLRWGITEAQSNNNQALPICLNEIDSSRPYFVGMLGERYGWNQFKLDDEIVSNYSFGDDDLDGTSITHLEIMYGVLNVAHMQPKAVFYIRDEEYSKQFDEFCETDSEKKEKLANLKHEIRESQYKHFDYKTPEEFAEMVEKFLMDIINERFPKSHDEMDKFKRIEGAIDRYAANKLPQDIVMYDGRVQTIRPNITVNKYLHALESKINENIEHPIVVLGHAGFGKTTILANYMDICKRRISDTVKVVEYYTASSQEASNWATMISYIMHRIIKEFNLSYDIPTDHEKLKDAFIDLLHEKIPSHKQCIIAIDGIEKLYTEGNYKDELGWLPYELPVNVRMIITVPESKAYEELLDRGSNIVLGVRSFDENEAGYFILGYLKEKRKSLDFDLVLTIARCEAQKTPAYLKLLIDELCAVGEFNRLNRQITDYISAANTTQLFEMILSRWENDYDTHREHMTRDTLSYLYASNSGLSEGELLTLLGEESKPLPPAYFASLKWAATGALSNNDGLYTLANKYVKDAVGKKCVCGREKEIHSRLADFYEKSELLQLKDKNDVSRRCLLELSAHYLGAQQYDKLYTFLKDISIACRMYEEDKYLLQECWVNLEENGYYPQDAYKAYMDAPQKYYVDLLFISDLLNELGHVGQASSIRSALIPYYERANDTELLNAALLTEANACIERGELQNAHNIYEAIMTKAQKMNDSYLYHKILVTDAVALKLMGKIRRADKNLDKAIEYFESNNYKKDWATALENKAVNFKNAGNINKALALLDKAERVSRQSYNPAGLVTILGSKGLIYKDMGEYDMAIPLYQEVIETAQKLGLSDILQLTYGNLGVVYYMQSRYVEAFNMQKQKEQICRETNSLQSLCQAIGNIGNLFRAFGRDEEAISNYKENIKICTENNFKKELQSALGNLGCVYSDRMMLDDAIKLFCRQMKICDELNYPYGKIMGLHNCAIAYEKQHDKKRAIKNAEDALMLAQRCGYASLVNSIQDTIEQLKYK